MSYDESVRRKGAIRTALLAAKCLRDADCDAQLSSGQVRDLTGRVDAGQFYLSNIYVEPQWQSMGIGSRLMLEVETRAVQRGCRDVCLDVAVSNATAMRLYQRRGYAAAWTTEAVVVGTECLQFQRLVKRLDIDPTFT